MDDIYEMKELQKLDGESQRVGGEGVKRLTYRHTRMDGDGGPGRVRTDTHEVGGLGFRQVWGKTKIETERVVKEIRRQTDR
jgi:hypothetical protein